MQPSPEPSSQPARSAVNVLTGTSRRNRSRRQTGRRQRSVRFVSRPDRAARPSAASSVVLLFYRRYDFSMRISKERLTVTVEPHLVQAGNEAVAEGRVGSLSAWVNLALVERAAKERRLRALADAIAAYEQEFGVMTSEELQAQERADRASARVVRGAGPRGAKARR